MGARPMRSSTTLSRVSPAAGMVGHPHFGAMAPQAVGFAQWRSDYPGPRSFGYCHLNLHRMDVFHVAWPPEAGVIIQKTFEWTP
jgi:hypothetical protein